MSRDPMGHTDDNTSHDDQRTIANVGRWAKDLIDLSHRNHALYHRPTKRASLSLLSPDPISLHRQLSDSDPLAFFMPPVEEPGSKSRSSSAWTIDRSLEMARPDEVVTDRVDGTDLQRTLTNLMRTTNQDWLDRAVRTLYVAFGQLVWSEDLDGKDVVRSPLVYVPVTLRRGNARELFRLEKADDDPVLNPSLVMKLQDAFGLDLMPIALRVHEMSTIDEVFEELEEAVDDAGWAVEHAAALKRATFHKEAMYRDLVNNMSLIAEHPIVRSLAGVPSAQTDDPTTGLIDDSRLDRDAPPEQAHLVLDADASQRRAVLAATGGLSFVMDGPPGTGKSQTIVNMIAELMAEGRSVLFVSEKAAALEVVAKRLADVGIEDFLLELHSHKANRREVVKELARCLTMQPNPSGGMGDAERERLLQRRRELNDYAEAVNETRMPLARSVAWVAGRVASLHASPELVPVTQSLDKLDLATLDSLIEDAKVLAASWDRVHADAFLWRDSDVPMRTSLDLVRRELRRTSDAVALIHGAEAAAAASLVQLPVPTRAEELRHIVDRLDLIARRPEGTPAVLLTVDRAELAGVEQQIELVAGAVAVVGDAEEQVRSAYGSRWSTIELPTPEDVRALIARMASELPSLKPATRLSSDAVNGADAALTSLIEELEHVTVETEQIAQLCGADARGLNWDQLRRIAEVAARADATPRPHPTWLEAKTSFAVEQALHDLATRHETARETGRRAKTLLTPSAQDVDLPSAASSYRLSKTRLFAFDKSTREARRVLRSSLGPDYRKLNDAQITLAVRAWQAQRKLVETEDRYHDLLGMGMFARDGMTDLSAARAALGLAMDARRAAGDSFDTRTAALQFCEPTPRERSLTARGRRLSADLGRLTERLDGLGALGVGRLQHQRLSEVTSRLLATREAIGVLQRSVGPALEARLGPASLDDILRSSVAAEDLAAARAALAAALAALSAALPGMPPLDTLSDDEMAQLSSALAWTKELQSAHGAPLSPEQAELTCRMVVDPSSVESLRRIIDQHDSSLVQVRTLLGPATCARFATSLDATAQEITRFLGELNDTVEQLPEWWDHAEARESIIAAGLSEQLKDAMERQLPADQLAPALERVVLVAWLEWTLLNDQRLSRTTAGKRDGRVEEFRRMDRALLTDAAHRVVTTCAARRPRANFGGVALILREANKKTRHRPVRQLLEESGPVVTRLKPCFMMSPLAVSQYIPADWRFDVVIFDEASQIPPQDAINCIYRADQVIIAGDDRQLPPTSFFEMTVQDDGETDEEIELDDFESVLGLAKASDLLSDLGLRWHYRSRHEDLITFSNHSFYDGELITYPGAHANSPALGVQHYLVEDGVYRRGTRRDNPREAQKVAERVAFHVRENPGLSIGVVALSSAQAEAIEDAVDQLRQNDPALDKAFRADRLDGFFVKNLESVQGDDRDIIILSIGYGPDETGRLTMNFGPMNQSGGWRRLNVAVTRARNRMELVSSFTADRIRVGDSKGSLGALKSYMEYAERGPLALFGQPTGSLGDVESPLEAEVLRTIRSWGYDAVPQVGSASYRIDIGVRDPSDPDRYAIGVECDGATYHSSKVARDRDRLRQQVLEGLGWRLHRVWSPTWYRNRRAAEDALRLAIEAAIADEPVDGATEPNATQEVTRLELRHEEIDPLGPPGWAEPYRAYVPAPHRGKAEDARSRSALRKVITEMVAVEAPVHISRVETMVAQAFSQPRDTDLAWAVGMALQELDKLGVAAQYEDDIVRVPGGKVVVRYPTTDENVRSTPELPPEEVELAVWRLIEDTNGGMEDELPRAIRDLFGFKRLGSRIVSAVQTAVEDLEAAGCLEREPSGRLRAVTPPLPPT